MNSLQFSELKTTDLVVTSKTFGLLRKALIEHLGQQKAKRFLLRFGKEMGIEKAKELLGVTENLKDLLKKAPLLHVALRHVSNITSEGSIIQRKDSVQFEDVRGIWYDSFEVTLQLQDFGISNECSCYILSGFASGILTTFYQEEIFVKEVTCCAKGDAYCSFEVNTKTYWETIHEEPLAIYDAQTIIDELEVTYDKLLEQTQLLHKVSHFHSQITESIAKQNGIQQLLKTAFSLLNIPIFLTDTDGHLLFQEGQIETAVNVKHLLQKKKLAPLTTERHKIESVFFLITPVFLDDHVYAYCYFLYEQISQIPSDDHLYLERLAVAASLCFLNEKVSFETTERLKINFLDRLIYNQFQNNSELALHANYIEPKIVAPFYTIALKLIHSKRPGVLTDHYQILLSIAKSLKVFHLHGLLSQKEDHILLFLYDLKDEERNFKTLAHILTTIEKSVPHFQFKAGVSQRFEELSHFPTSVKEAEQAMNFPKQATFIYYKELGFFSALLENVNPDVITVIAKQELHSLLEPDEKNKELLYTLYVFLKNNQKLEKTMYDLSLSIGGIKYRITKIEKILGKNFKDATTTAHLLLLLETLILMNKLSFD
jgi:sugar diacid utilization regulator/predicted hydrocarbon binding protein